MALVDSNCYLKNVQIFSDSNRSYTCTLNQVDISKNSNKFYIIQLLTDGQKYYMFTRYGRVGDKGICNHKEFSDSYSAINEFRKQFKSKTGNEFGCPFQKKPGKYMLLEMEAPKLKSIISSDPSPTTVAGTPSAPTTVASTPSAPTTVAGTPLAPTTVAGTPLAPTTVADVATFTDVSNSVLSLPGPPKLNISSSPPNLHPKVLEVIRKIGSSKMMTETLIKLDLDVNRMPLGKISRNMIIKAHEILTDLSNRMGKMSHNEIIERSSEFWTLVPYATKRNIRPPILDNINAITQCSQLLDTLENIEIAGTILQKSNNEYDIYKSLGITLTPIDDGEELDIIRRFVKNTHARTHRYRLDLLQVYRIEKPVQDTNLFESVNNHKLLFHGSRMANFMGILSEGLRIPRPSQVSNGSTLGRGLYFADAVSKSYNYTYSNETDHTGFMVLCEVALGNPHVVYGCCDKDYVDPGYNSRWAKGNSTTNEQEYVTLPNSQVVVPCGNIIPNPEAVHSTFLYNEFVIYNTQQYRFRYLIYLRDF